MKLTVTISEATEKALKDQAQRAGLTEETLAAYMLERALAGVPDLQAISGEIHEAFQRSGMSEDDLSELLEAEKHAMRAEKRKKAS